MEDRLRGRVGGVAPLSRRRIDVVELLVGGVMMAVATPRIAQFLGLSEAELVQKALRSLLLEQKRTVLQTRLEILARYRATDIADLEQKISDGTVAEHPAWEDLITAENLGARWRRSMTISSIYEHLRQVAREEFGDIVVSTDIETLPTGDPRKLRLHMVDGSFVDVFVSLTGRYSYHWQRLDTAGGALYRHDNAPHVSWRNVSTYPRHFHDGTEENVVASHLSSDPPTALREFCRFVRHTLRS